MKLPHFRSNTLQKIFTGICFYLKFSPIIITSLLGCSNANEFSKTNFSPDSESSELISKWKTEHWSKKEYYSLIPSENGSGMSLAINADSLTYSRWFYTHDVIPYSQYRFEGMIKTTGIKSDNENAGAGFRLGPIPTSNNPIFSGDNDWNKVDFIFETGGDDSVILECVLGLGGRSTGKVLFDQISLTLLSSERLNPQLSADLSETMTPMTELIYGQFIEHMGNCIYGGIWAEMLKDRKFYFIPGAKGSPWHIIGDTNAIALSTQAPYNGNHDLQIYNKNSIGNGFSQNNLHFRSNQRYIGRIVADIQQDNLPLTVIVQWGNETEHEIAFNIDKIQQGYATYHFDFIPTESTQNGTLKIVLKGEGQASIAAVSLMPDDNIYGFRNDVFQLMKSLEAPVYRWPGGNFVSGYDWKDGIGDPDKRPSRYEKAWEGWAQHFPIETNDVGMDEFLLLCKLLGAKPNIAVNTGLGTPEEAAQQVEYANGSIETPMGAWRAANGHKTPYGVKLWAVGNEMFGDWQLGVMPVEDYVLKHNKTSRLMWDVDPDIELIAVGFPGKWNETMYTHSASYMTHISEHFYRQDWHAGGVMTHVKQIPDAIRQIAEEHRKWREAIPGLEGKDIKIAMDEWNYWYGPHVYGLLGTRYFLRDALGIAAGINEFLRQSDIYMMANYAQTVNVIGAIKATPSESFMEGTGMVLRMYRRYFGTIPVKTDYNTAPMDVAVALSSDRKTLTISVINPTENLQHLNLELLNGKISHTGSMHYITGNDPMDYNGLNQNKIREYALPITVTDNVLHVEPMSASIFRFPVQ